MAGMPGPGDRIEARCTRCNDVTGHVVVALVGGQIVKVECRACGSVHKYYPPAAPRAEARTRVCRVKSGEDRKQAVASAPSSSSGRAASAGSGVPRGTAKSRKAAEELEAAWQKTVQLAVGEPKKYSMDLPLSEGDVVDHPTFGLGVVRELEPPDKARILFRDAVRLLRCRMA